MAAVKYSKEMRVEVRFGSLYWSTKSSWTQGAKVRVGSFEVKEKVEKEHGWTCRLMKKHLYFYQHRAVSNPRREGHVQDKTDHLQDA